jgi:hypothetical protein
VDPVQTGIMINIVSRELTFDQLTELRNSFATMVANTCVRDYSDREATFFEVQVGKVSYTDG